jgi:NAD(P)-dependent dehydrogenase (short-subunit alcohol dehydrogenase family)
LKNLCAYFQILAPDIYSKYLEETQKNQTTNKTTQSSSTMGNTATTVTNTINEKYTSTSSAIKHNFNNVTSTITSSLPFGQTSTADQVAKDTDLSNQVILVTGGTDGIGLETVRVLYNHGAHVVVTYREDDNKISNITKTLNEQRQQNSSNKDIVQNMNGEITFMQADLRSLTSISDFVIAFKNKFNSLNTLILNESEMIPPLTYTKDGFELQFGVNFLAHFNLTMQLLTIMKETTENELNRGRIVVLSSFAHEFITGIIFDDLFWKKRPYNTGWTCFAESSLENIMFTIHLSKLLQKNGVDIDVNAVDPGIVKSSLIMDEHALSRIGIWLTHPFIKTLPQGAATSVFCAVSPALENISGQYFSDCQHREPSKLTKDNKMENKIWSIAEKFSRQSYPFSVSSTL